MRTKSLITISFILLAAMLLAAASSPAAQTASAAEELPDYAFVEMSAHGQTYPLSCESRSAADLAGYWGLSVNEVEFFNNLPVSDNPEKGFVGSVFGTWGQTPPNPYGVHAQPIAKLLREYGLDAQAQMGLSVKDLKTEIANGRPLIVWMIGHVWSGTPIQYTAKDGSKMTVAQYEHTMIAYGYDLSGIYLIDAGSAARQSFAYSTFKTSWAVLGNMGVTATGQLGSKNEESPAPTEAATKPDKTDNMARYVVQPGDYLNKLAQEWDISWQDLAALNNIVFPYTIYPGQVLLTGQKIGEDAPQEPEPTATPKPTKEAEEEKEAEAEPSPAPTRTPDPTPVPEIEESVNVYVVQSGDHLMQIARNLEADWVEIAELNELTWPYAVFPGQKLLLPEGVQPPAEEEKDEETDEEAEATKQSDKEMVETEPKPTATPKPTEAAAEPETYTVQKGEHLMQIARKLTLSWQAIAQTNHLSPPYTLQPGQVLTLPGTEAGPTTPPLEADEETSTESSGETYVVQKGEYLYSLAQRFGVSWQSLAAKNNIGYPYVVYPGQTLVIP